jgi:hypothetical protein
MPLFRNRGATANAPEPAPKPALGRDELMRRAARATQLEQLMRQVRAMGDPASEDVALCQKLVDGEWGDVMAAIGQTAFMTARELALAHVDYATERGKLLGQLHDWQQPEGAPGWRVALRFVAEYRGVWQRPVYPRDSEAVHKYRKWLAACLGCTYSQAHAQLSVLAHQAFLAAVEGMAKDRSCYDEVVALWTNGELASLEIAFKWPTQFYQVMFTHEPWATRSDLIWVPWRGLAGDSVFDASVFDTWVAYAWQRTDPVWARVILLFCDGRAARTRVTAKDLLGDAYWPLRRLVAAGEPPYSPDTTLE